MGIFGTLKNKYQKWSNNRAAKKQANQNTAAKFRKMHEWRYTQKQQFGASSLMLNKQKSNTLDAALRSIYNKKNPQQSLNTNVGDLTPENIANLKRQVPNLKTKYMGYNNSMAITRKRKRV